MANKKELKKDINFLTYELVTECLTYQSFHQNISLEKVGEVVNKILDLREDLIKKVNQKTSVMDAKSVKSHFNTIREEFERSISYMDELAVTK